MNENDLKLLTEVFKKELETQLAPIKKDIKVLKHDVKTIKVNQDFFIDELDRVQSMIK